MSPAARLIDRFGGDTELARELGKPVTTVAHWRRAGAIHDRHKPAIIRAGLRRGMSLGIADFVDMGE